MKVPNILDLVELEIQSIRDKEEKLKQLESNPFNCYICESLREEIEKSKKTLSKFKPEVREQNLKQLGL